MTRPVLRLLGAIDWTAATSGSARPLGRKSALLVAVVAAHGERGIA
ncbi:MAG: hypothetical protein R3E48_09170 [Burkholderiaceae bacterium]